MRKRAELAGPSCMTSARDDEMVFVLLARDAAAPLAIRTWCDERIRLGLNVETDAKIIEARACADTMDKERKALVTDVFRKAMTDGRNTIDTSGKDYED